MTQAEPVQTARRFRRQLADERERRSRPMRSFRVRCGGGYRIVRKEIDKQS